MATKFYIVLVTPDRHLGKASIDRLKPDLLITESTYATTIRDPRNSRERDFLHTVHQCVEKGGKVLIPVFALGRAQELCILLEGYWERMNLSAVPIYFSAGMVEKANLYYKLFLHWTNQKIKKTFVDHNMFDFKHIQPFDRSLMDAAGPMVVFATPGMLHAGMSLEIFRHWCGDEKNCCILPGYCVAGTFGNTLLKQKKGRMELDRRTMVDVKLYSTKISFSAHADAKGILELIQQVQPRNVMLVHGEKEKMMFLKEKIETDLKIPCSCPPNGFTVSFKQDDSIEAKISMALVQKALLQKHQQSWTQLYQENKQLDKFDKVIMNDSKNNFPIVDGVLIIQQHEDTSSVDGGSKTLQRNKSTTSSIFELSKEDNTEMKPITTRRYKNNNIPLILDHQEAASELGIIESQLKFIVEKQIVGTTIHSPLEVWNLIRKAIKNVFEETSMFINNNKHNPPQQNMTSVVTTDTVIIPLEHDPKIEIKSMMKTEVFAEEKLQMNSVLIEFQHRKEELNDIGGDSHYILVVSWTIDDDLLGEKVIDVIESLLEEKMEGITIEN